MRIVVGADHRGYELKNALAASLRENGYDVLDVGTNGPDSVDYPDIALAVGEAIRDGRAERGVLVCGGGAGWRSRPGRLPGIAGRFCTVRYSPPQEVRQDARTVLSWGGAVIGEGLAGGTVGVSTRRG